MSARTLERPAEAPAPGPAPPGPAPHTLIAADGRALAAAWFEPPAVPARAVAVVNPAAGVPRRFYRAFAQWMAARGYAVLTYDYRGIGESRRGAGLRGDPATMRDWALLDMPAALAAAEARRGGGALPLLLVGHSFGGNAIGFADGVERADALLAVASQAGEWRQWPARHRALVAAFFGGWVPALVRLHGHLPGWALGAGAQPMPAGVARDWARWGLRRGYFWDDPAMRPHSRYRGIVAPVHLWSIDDDWAFAPARAVDALAERFPLAAMQRRHLHPREVGVRSIGHFSMFRRDLGPQVWPRLLAPVEAAAPALRQAGLLPA